MSSTAELSENMHDMRKHCYYFLIIRRLFRDLNIDWSNKEQYYDFFNYFPDIWVREDIEFRAKDSFLYISMMSDRYNELKMSIAKKILNNQIKIAWIGSDS